MLDLSLCNPHTFKGLFLFATDRLAAMHIEQPFDMAYHETIGYYTGVIKREYFKVNKYYYCYIVNHGNECFTFNEWYGGQVVPKMTDITKTDFQQFKELGLTI